MVITRKGRLFGVLRVNTALRHGLEGAWTGATMADVANRDFIVVPQDEVVFDVIERMWRKKAVMALVVTGRGIPHAEDVLGVITKEHVADSVADSVKIYSRG